MADKQPLSFRWDPDFVARIDETRGDVPRSTWVQRAVELRIHLRNLTNEEIDRLLEDWHARSQMRELDGSYDDTDRGIAIKAPAPRKSKKGARHGS